MTVIGPYTLLSWGFMYAPVVLLFFAAYYALDFIVQWKRDRVGQQGFGESHALEEKSGDSRESGER